MIRHSRGAAGISARALGVGRSLFRAARVRTTSLWSLGDTLLGGLAARTSASGSEGLFDNRNLGCFATRSCTSTRWRFNNGLDLRIARVRRDALGIIVADTPVLGATRSGAAGLGRAFFETLSLGTARVGASGVGGRRLGRLVGGAARFGTIVLDGWSFDRLVVGAARTGAVSLCWGFFDWGLVLRTARSRRFDVSHSFHVRLGL
jgi:hypothetical protein